MTQLSATPRSSFSDLSTAMMDNPVGFKLAHHRPDLGSDIWRQSFGRFIKQQKPGVRHQRPANGQHLLFTA